VKIEVKLLSMISSLVSGQEGELMMQFSCQTGPRKVFWKENGLVDLADLEKAFDKVLREIAQWA
jgi:Reverse transcriptase (RNA-dependent DNA polymerase)